MSSFWEDIIVPMIVTVMMMVGLVRGQFVDCQVAPPPVNKTGATALPHMGRITITVASFCIDPARDNDAIGDEEYLFILMQQMQRTAMKAPRKTRQAMVRTATFCWSSLGL